VDEDVLATTLGRDKTVTAHIVESDQLPDPCHNPTPLHQQSHVGRQPAHSAHTTA
jgi:hypothetical protein